MVRTQQDDPSQEHEPTSLAEIPPSYSRVTGEAWIVEGMMQMQKTLGELSARVDGLKSTVENHEQTFRVDFRWTWTGLAVATILLMSALIFGYFKLDDRQSTLSTGFTKIETKMDDMLLRLPAPPASVLSPGSPRH
jgi:hypothetical protein